MRASRRGCARRSRPDSRELGMTRRSPRTRRRAKTELGGPRKPARLGCGPRSSGAPPRARGWTRPPAASLRATCGPTSRRLAECRGSNPRTYRPSRGGWWAVPVTQTAAAGESAAPVRSGHFMLVRISWDRRRKARAIEKWKRMLNIGDGNNFDRRTWRQLACRLFAAGQWSEGSNGGTARPQKFRRWRVRGSSSGAGGLQALWRCPCVRSSCERG